MMMLRRAEALRRRARGVRGRLRAHLERAAWAGLVLFGLSGLAGLAPCGAARAQGAMAGIMASIEVSSPETLEEALGRMLAAAFPSQPPSWAIDRQHPFDRYADYTFRLVAPQALRGGRNWFQLHGERGAVPAADRGDGTRLGAGEGDVKSFLLPVDVHWEDSVWVANRPLASGAVLEQGDLIRRWGRHTQLPRDVSFAEPPVGMALTRSLQAGEVVVHDAVAPPPVVKRGEIVRLVYRNGGLLVSARAEALESGALGEEIRVRPLDARRTCRGRVHGQAEVEVVVP